MLGLYDGDQRNDKYTEYLLPLGLRVSPNSPGLRCRPCWGPGQGSLNVKRSSYANLPVDLSGTPPSRMLGKTVHWEVFHWRASILRPTEVGARGSCCWPLHSARASHWGRCPHCMSRTEPAEQHAISRKQNPLLFQGPSNAVYRQSLTPRQLAKEKYLKDPVLYPQSMQKGWIWS